MTASTRKPAHPDNTPAPPARGARGRPSSRQRILEAAADLFSEAGVAHVSLEAVAERAGVSKGGLLYNFPSKLLLLKALVANHLLNLDIRRGEAEAALGAGRNRAARAHLTAVCDLEGGPPPSGLLAALAESPDLLDPLRANARAFAEKLRADDDPLHALTAFLAIEGLKALDLFEANPLTAEERVAVVAFLDRELARER